MDKIFNCKSLIIGHRGVKTTMENTLESILQAIDMGVDGIEFDVWTCLTGEMILFHDKTLDRLAFKDEFFFNKTQGKNINQLQWYHLYNTELIDTMGKKYKIPKLYDILSHPKVYNSDVLINIELKDNSHEDLSNMIAELIEDGLYNPGRFLISSEFIGSLIYLDEFKKDLSEENKKYLNLKIGRIYSPENIIEKSLLEAVKSDSKVVTHVVLDKSLINSDIIDKIKKMKLDIFVYTVNDVDYNINTVEGIITDKPWIFF